VTLLHPKILSWLLYFLQICALLVYPTNISRVNEENYEIPQHVSESTDPRMRYPDHTDLLTMTFGITLFQQDLRLANFLKIFARM